MVFLCMVVSNIFYFHPYLGKIPILTNIFQRGWNHQPVLFWVKSNLNQAILEKRKVYEKGFVTEEGKTQFLDVLNVAAIDEQVSWNPHL